MQIPGVPDHGEVAPDAVAADRIVAFRERVDDRGLVRKVLIERAERHAAALDDVAHAEGFAAFFSHQLGRACAAADPASHEATSLWARYLTDWMLWNHVRTVSSTAACVLFIAAIAAR